MIATGLVDADALRAITFWICFVGESRGVKRERDVLRAKSLRVYEGISDVPLNIGLEVTTSPTHRIETNAPPTLRAKRDAR